MKYVASEKKSTEKFVKGNLIERDGHIYLVTDENTIVCVYSSSVSFVGTAYDVYPCDSKFYTIYHGAITMEN